MTLDALRYEMVAAIKARDKGRQAIIEELLALAKAELTNVSEEEQPAKMAALLAAELKKSKERLLVSPAGREDIKSQIKLKIELLESYVNR